MSHEAGEQPGQRVDRLRNLSKRLDAAAGEGADEAEDQIRSHPDVQVTTCLQAFGCVLKSLGGKGGGVVSHREGHREDAFPTRQAYSRLSSRLCRNSSLICSKVFSALVLLNAMYSNAAQDHLR